MPEASSVVQEAEDVLQAGVEDIIPHRAAVEAHEAAEDNKTLKIQRGAPIRPLIAFIPAFLRDSTDPVPDDPETELIPALASAPQ